MKKVKIVKILLMLILVALVMSNYTLSQQWEVVPSPNPSPVRNLLRGVGSISSNDVWAVGEWGYPESYTLTQHWNGSNWTTINSPSPGSYYNVLYAVQGLSTNNVYAVGDYTGIPATPQMLVLRWDGSSWTQQNTPTVTGGSSLHSILAFAPDDIYAGGHKAIGAPGPLSGTLVLHWNGSSWNIEDTPNQSDNRSNVINDMKGLSANDIWAVGYSRRIAENYQAMVLHKTGSDWNIVPVPQHPGAENFLYSIDIIAPDNIWAAGEYNDGSNYSPYFLHYNGSNWSIVNSAGGGGGIVSNSANDIWSSGSPFAHYDGTTWNVVNTPIPTSGTIGTMARISSTDIWTVGRYIDGQIMKTLTMHYGSGFTPVELAFFTAKVVGTAVQLNWKTATEVNNYGFDVESRNDQETEWEKIAFVQGHGNSNSPRDYFYIDKKVKSGKYLYRLKQIDYDGSFEYSDIVEVDVNNIPNEFSLGQNYPNPFNPGTIIEFSIPEDAVDVKLTIYDALGQRITELVNTKLEAGKYQYQWNASNAAGGLYIYELRTSKFNSVKKMLLMK